VLRSLHDELAGYPGVSLEAPPVERVGIVLPLVLRTPIGRLSFLTTIARFGAASDVTLAELSVESFFPADEQTAKRIAASGRAAATGR
jgi:hypothetical protein